VSQFDVHRNPGRSRDWVPYVVVVQSASFSQHNRRIVVPLPLAGALPASTLNPIFTIENRRVILDTLDIVSVDIGKLGEKVASLNDAGDQIVAALDEVFSRAWG
jgi:toxin CcdB